MNSLVRRVLIVTFAGVILYGLFAVYTGVQQIGFPFAGANNWSRSWTSIAKLEWFSNAIGSTIPGHRISEWSS